MYTSYTLCTNLKNLPNVLFFKSFQVLLSPYVKL